MLLQIGQQLPRLIDVPTAAERPGAVQVGALGLISLLRRLRECLRGLGPALHVLERDPLEVRSHAHLADLLQVVETGMVTAQQYLANAKPEVRLGLDRLLPLLSLLDVGHGLSECPITRWVAVEQLTQVRHRRNVERGAIHDRAHVGGHHLGHAILSPLTALKRSGRA